MAWRISPGMCQQPQAKGTYGTLGGKYGSLICKARLAKQAHLAQSSFTWRRCMNEGWEIPPPRSLEAVRADAEWAAGRGIDWCGTLLSCLRFHGVCLTYEALKPKERQRHDERP
jgi:hypothetical protein